MTEAKDIAPRWAIRHGYEVSYFEDLPQVIHGDEVFENTPKCWVPRTDLEALCG